MSLRAVPRRLARPVSHRAATTTASAASLPGSEAPLLQFPAFHPVPFQEDKFLSIKSRSVETYAKVRADVLQRCAELRAQLLRRRLDQTGPQTVSSSSSGRDVTPRAGDNSDGELTPSVPLPLTPHQAEELLLLTKKVEDLVHHQGFLLTDELVWRMFHLCIQCGAPRLALKEWLHGHVLAEKRGPPYPLFILSDLSALLRCAVLPRLPESGATLTCSSAVLTAAARMRPAATPSGSARASVGLDDGLGAAQRCLELHRRGTGVQADDGDPEVEGAEGDAAGPAGAAQEYRAHLLSEYVWPVWRAMEGMQLTFAGLGRSDTAEDEDAPGDADAVVSEGVHDRLGAVDGDAAAHAGPAAWLPSVAAQTRAARAALMSVTPLYSFHAPPSPSTAARGADAASGAARTAALRAQALLCNSPPHFSSEAAAMVAPLRALLDTWLTVAQCAAEAKDMPLLRSVHRAVCRGFLSQGATDDAAAESVPSLVCVNERAWCDYAAAGSHEVAADVTHRHAAAQQARAVVREFVNSSLAVLQFGLLGAEQDALLWLLHDTSALVAGAAATLRGEGVQHDSALAGSCTDSAPLSRMAAVLAAQATAADCEAAKESRLALLQTALPAAIRACLGTAALHTHADAEHAGAVAAAHAFLRGAMADASPSGGVAAVYAEAAWYVGLATGDEALLRTCGAAEDAGAAGPGSDASRTAGVRRSARALQACRRAVSRLQTGEAEPDEADTASPAEVWAEWSAAVADIGAAAPSASDGPAARMEHLDSCLQALVLHATRLQLDRVTAFVRLAEQPAAVPDAAAEESAEVDGAGEGTGEGEPDAYARAEAEQTRRTAMEEAWAALQRATAATAQETLSRAEELLDVFAAGSSSDSASCLSPTSLSTLALLARLGPYVEETATDAGAPPADAVASPCASLDRVMARVVRDTCALLRGAAAGADGAAATTSVVGNWVQWVLVTLMARRAWADVLAVLRALDGSEADAATRSLLCSTTVDPAVFAALYARAMEDGAASVCAFLRPRRELLFF